MVSVAPTTASSGSRRFPNCTRGTMVAALVVLLATVVGTAPLADNSFLTHLTTGRLIVSGTFPHSDPYSFTAPGRHWIVQSWFASLLYGLADKAAGGVGIRLLVAVITVLLALVVWRLSSGARGLMGRLLAVAAPLIMSTVVWGSRPLLFGLLFLALLMLIVEERRDPRWLVPLMWLWVNTHGSFPLGLVYILLGAIGGHFDGQDIKAELDILKWAVIGTLLGGIGPVGPQILWFPVELLSKQKLLAGLVEWQAPTFTDLWQKCFLGFVMAVIALLPRLPTDRRYRSTFLLAVFVGAALLGSRNMSVASLVLVPIMARELRGIGSISAATRSRVYGYVTAGLGVVCVIGLVAGLSRPSYQLSAYPVKSVTWLQDHHLLITDPKSTSDRMAARDIVGNYLEFRYRGKVKTFVDDRLDMFPPAIARGEAVLFAGSATWESVLDKQRINLVLWENKMTLADLMTQSPKWKVIHRDSKWTVFERRVPIS